MKPMSPLTRAENPVRRRVAAAGMPNLELTEDQIDQLVAYLNSLT